jgi:hypothetical protein
MIPLIFPNSGTIMASGMRICEWTYEDVCKDRETKGLPPVSIEEADRLCSARQIDVDRMEVSASSAAMAP